MLTKSPIPISIFDQTLATEAKRAWDKIFFRWYWMKHFREVSDVGDELIGQDQLIEYFEEIQQEGEALLRPVWKDHWVQFGLFNEDLDFSSLWNYCRIWDKFRIALLNSLELAQDADSQWPYIDYNFDSDRSLQDEIVSRLRNRGFLSEEANKIFNQWRNISEFSIYAGKQLFFCEFEAPFLEQEIGDDRAELYEICRSAYHLMGNKLTDQTSAGYLRQIYDQLAELRDLSTSSGDFVTRVNDFRWRMMNLSILRGKKDYLNKRCLPLMCSFANIPAYHERLDDFGRFKLFFNTKTDIFSEHFAIFCFNRSKQYCDDVLKYFFGANYSQVTYSGIAHKGNPNASLEALLEELRRNKSVIKWIKKNGDIDIGKIQEWLNIYQSVMDSFPDYNSVLPVESLESPNTQEGGNYVIAQEGNFLVFREYGTQTWEDKLKDVLSEDSLLQQILMNLHDEIGETAEQKSLKPGKIIEIIEKVVKKDVCEKEYYRNWRPKIATVLKHLSE
jgi:hypothetical protein